VGAAIEETSGRTGGFNTTTGSTIFSDELFIASPWLHSNKLPGSYERGFSSAHTTQQDININK